MHQIVKGPERIANITINIGEEEARLLPFCQSSPYVQEHPEGLFVIGYRSGDKNPFHSDFAEGATLEFHDLLSAIVFRDYERAIGFEATLLCYPNVTDSSQLFIVMSTRPGLDWWGGHVSDYYRCPLTDFR